MKISKGSFLHEVLILVLYIFLSPILFGVFYTEEIHGEGALIYVAIFFNSLYSVLISLVFIYFIKKKLKYNVIELTIGIIPLILSFVIFLRTFVEIDSDVISTFWISNTVSIFVVYLLSIAHKFRDYLGIG